MQKPHCHLAVLPSRHVLPAPRGLLCSETPENSCSRVCKGTYCTHARKSMLAARRIACVDCGARTVTSLAERQCPSPPYLFVFTIGVGSTHVSCQPYMAREFSSGM